MADDDDARAERIVALLPQCIFGVLAVVAAVVGWFGAWSPWIDYARADQYEPTPCVVEVAERRWSGRMWSIRLRYRYAVDGRDHVATRYGFADEVASRSPASLPSLPKPGSDQCFVRRGHPGDAVLRRSFAPETRIIAWGCLVATAFCAYGVLAFRGLRRREAARVARVAARRLAEGGHGPL